MQFEEAILSNQNFLTPQTSQMRKTAVSEAGQAPPEGGEATALTERHCQQVALRQTAGKGQNVIRPAA